MKCQAPGGGRGAFTLVEVAAVGGLMAFLAIVVSSAWSGLGRPTLDMIARSRVDQQASLAIASLGVIWKAVWPTVTGGLEPKPRVSTLGGWCPIIPSFGSALMGAATQTAWPTGVLPTR